MPEGGGGGKGNSHIKVTGMWVWLKPKTTPKGDFCVVSVRAIEYSFTNPLGS